MNEHQLRKKEEIVLGEIAKQGEVSVAFFYK